MEQLKGTICNEIFRNPSNGFAVFEIESGERRQTVTGNMPVLSIGETVIFTGEWTNHHNYGRQFSCKSIDIIPLTSADEILKYLQSKTVKGIGPATAKRIVEMFGDQSLNIIADNPKMLAMVKGISLDKAQAISANYAANMGSREVVMFLQKYNVSTASALKIFDKYKTSTISRIKENPYILLSVHGMGFQTVDKIALNLGFPQNSPVRFFYGIIDSMKNAIRQGHTCAPQKTIIEATQNLFDITEEEASKHIAMAIHKNRIVKRDSYLFLPEYDAAENCVASCVSLWLSDEVKEFPEISECQGIKLDNMQLKAVKTAISNKFSIITGGPGTGKTTIIRTLISTFQSQGLDVALCAPTGRAAKRISEVCDEEAKTIHRLLEVERTLDDDSHIFFRDEHNTLDCDVLIVDEASMLDLRLAAALFKAVKPHSYVVLVGDVDQLPPVGSGDVLRELIKSDVVPVVKLKEIFRQAKESHIIMNAHRINNGKYPIIDNNSDFRMFEKNTQEEILAEILDFAKQFDIKSSMQIMSPTRKGMVGVKNLNEELQAYINPPNSKKTEYRGFRVGDRVMQIKNNYDIEWQNRSDKKRGTGIFNGDIGFITAIDEENEIIEVIYDDDKITHYNPANLIELELAYATTVHKSQGSEYDLIIMPLFNLPPMLSTRNLLYTAITRARNHVILIGSESILHVMVNNAYVAHRYSLLAQRLTNII